MVTLQSLLQCLNIKVTQPKVANIAISNLQVDSRQVTANTLFIAIPGASTDGSLYIKQAIARGAVAVLVAAPYSSKIVTTVPIIEVAELTKKLAILANFFYADPSATMKIIGVTGTNGKSSTCHYIAEIFRGLTTQCATIGTLGISAAGGYLPTKNTTPDVLTLQKSLAALASDGIKKVAMEVSSHALLQQRVAGVKFHSVVFTNLTQDHLDYHQTMLNYWQAKLKLFLEFAYQHAVINIDDPYGRQLLPLLPANAQIITYSLKEERQRLANCLVATNIQYINYGLRFTLNYQAEKQELTLPILGNFNVANMLAAIGVGLGFGYKLTDILAVVSKITGIPGRMQWYQQQHSPLIVIDYAHTPDALAKALQTLQYYCSGKLCCVFGCGGDRDKTKRPIMLATAVKFSDYVILTQDNPRTENPSKIIADMLSGTTLTKNIIIELDRRAAIEIAIKNASKEDVILIAGKGHEDYQIIGTKQIPFADAQVVEEYLRNT